MEISSSAGFAGAVSLACSGAPPLGSCTVTTNPPSTPPTVQVNSGSPAQFQVVVTTMAAAPIANERLGTKWHHAPMPALSLWLLTVYLAAWFFSARMARRSLACSGARRKRLVRSPGIVEAVAFLLAVALAVAACGGGGGGSDAVSAGTPAGTDTLTVTATGPSGAAHSIPLSLTVR